MRYVPYKHVHSREATLATLHRKGRTDARWHYLIRLRNQKETSDRHGKNAP